MTDEEIATINTALKAYVVSLHTGTYARFEDDIEYGGVRLCLDGSFTTDELLQIIAIVKQES